MTKRIDTDPPTPPADEVAKLLNELIAHHTELNTSKGRPVSHSKTIKLAQAALDAYAPLVAKARLAEKMAGALAHVLVSIGEINSNGQVVAKDGFDFDHKNITYALRDYAALSGRGETG